jgi:hypothetical protein
LPVGYQTLLQSVKLNAAGSETVSSLGVSSLALQNPTAKTLKPRPKTLNLTLPPAV